MGYLDSNGLSYFWGKIKSYIAGLGYYTKPSGGIPASDIASGVIPTVPTTLSSFTDDLGSSPTHTHSQYLTSAPVTSVNGQTGAVSLSIPTESTVSGWGFTKNAGTVTSVTVNGSTYSPTNGDVDLGTIGGGGGTSVQADWAQTDSTASDFIKNKPSANGAYFAAWTASSSAAVGARLTNTLTLPEGVYIIRGQYPATSKSLSSQLYLSNAKSLYNVNLPSGSSTYCFYVGSGYLTIFEIIFVGQGGGEVYLVTAQSASTTYTLLERGFIAAIKIV